MSQKILTYLPLIALAWTIITFALGHFIGHRAALNRDKIKEYNALVSPIRMELLKQIESIRKNNFYTAKINRDQVIMISDMLPAHKASEVLNAYEKYARSTSFDGLQSSFGEYGIIHIGNTKDAFFAASDLLKTIPKR